MPRVTTLVLAAFLSSFATSAIAYPPSHLWSKKFGSSQSNEIGDALATDAACNVILAAHVASSTDFGGGLVMTAGFSDGYMAKYDANGNYLWSRRMGGSGQDDWVSAVAVDGSGNIYVIGNFYASVDFGLGILTSAGQLDTYVAKFSSSGAVIWNKRYGSTGQDWGRSIAVDASGNVFVTGDFSGTVNFGGSNLIAVGGSDLFLVKLDTAGNHVVSSRYGSASGETGNALACDPFGSVVLTGTFHGTTSFGGSSLVSTGVGDIVLAKYDNNLVHVWSKRLGGTTEERGWSVATTWSGDIYMTGTFTGSVDFGGGALPGAALDDIVLAKYTTNGTHIWS